MSDLTSLSCTELIARIESLEHALANYSGQLTSIQGNMSMADWYGDHYGKGEVLKDLAEILGITPTQTVSITAVITVSMSHEVPLDELDNFDAESLVSDQLSVDAYGGDTSLDDWSVDSADWEEQ
jgi:hypothetical protein